MQRIWKILVNREKNLPCMVFWEYFKYLIFIPQILPRTPVLNTINSKTKNQTHLNPPSPIQQSQSLIHNPPKKSHQSPHPSIPHAISVVIYPHPHPSSSLPHPSQCVPHHPANTPPLTPQPQTKHTNPSTNSR